MSLDGELNRAAQNLVYARNGTGKSFLSRAFRVCDMYGQSEDLSSASLSLVSDEAPNGKAEFTFSRGEEKLGELILNREANTVAASVNDTVFHVFSEDFVNEELREREYVLDGQIENEIAIDSDTINIQSAKDELEAAVKDEEDKLSTLKETFETEKVSELKTKAGVNKRLKDYFSLDIVAMSRDLDAKPSQPARRFATILEDLDKLKSIPADPLLPTVVARVVDQSELVREVVGSILRVTSPSSVSERIKAKIDEHHDFIKEGSDIVAQSHSEQCPFCEQSIKAVSPKALIDAYVEYFEDEEEKHKEELRGLRLRLTTADRDLKDAETALVNQRGRYDTLKQFIPSKQSSVLSSFEACIEEARAEIMVLKGAIEDKVDALAKPQMPPPINLEHTLVKINAVVAENNQLVDSLVSAVEKADEERKSLHREACEAFGKEFLRSNWARLEDWRAAKAIVIEKQAALSELENSSPSTSARERVADTFAMLLTEFFAEKYVLDRETFTLKRGNLSMERGPNRTLSDGEKTAIAFCYFIASIHRKVTANSQYGQLFLVFDDPVNSMSYDYIFAIAQVLKNLSISSEGVISTNPSKISGGVGRRPNLLILTHSSYFFNVARTNRVVKAEATFALNRDGDEHKLSRLQAYVAPFEQQLEQVYKVSNGAAPDHSTGNSIRSVLEAVGRFCRPDKAESLQEFVTFLAGEGDIGTFQSVLVQSLSHGTYYDETPTPEDLILACKETIRVVNRYAEGHVEILKKALV